MTYPEIDVWWSRQRGRSSEDSSAVLASEARLLPPSGTAVVARWPTRFDKRLAAAATSAGKEAVEEREARRWSAAAVELALKAQLPLAQRLAGTDRESLLNTAIGRGLRSTTLRKRVRDARSLVRFLERSHGIAWPRTAEDLLDYILVRAEEPCGKSVLNSLTAAVYFFEEGGGVPAADRLSTDPLIVNTVKGLQKDLAMNGKPLRPAPREPVSFLAYRERLVVDVSQPRYARAYAWWKNVQAWSTLRFGDHEGLKPSTLRLSEGNLRGELTRTKTTGPDKQVASRAFVVAAGCYLLEPSWLEEGLRLWDE